MLRSRARRRRRGRSRRWWRGNQSDSSATQALRGRLGVGRCPSPAAPAPPTRPRTRSKPGIDLAAIVRIGPAATRLTRTPCAARGRGPGSGRPTPGRPWPRPSSRRPARRPWRRRSGRRSSRRPPSAAAHAMASDFSEYAETCTAVATSSQVVFEEVAAERGLRGERRSSAPRRRGRPRARATRVGQRRRGARRSVTSSSITGGGVGQPLGDPLRPAIIRPKPVSTTVAPSSWASRATWNAIEASVSTPVTRMRLPSRIPMVVSAPCPGRRRPG